jgi:hypothetical protein
MQQSTFNAKPYNVNARITHVGNKTVDSLGATSGLPVAIDDAGITAIQTAGITMHPTHFSPQHFTVVYTSASTLTCTPLYGMPAIDSSTMNVVSIMALQVGNTASVYINGRDGIVISAAANVLSIYKDGAALSAFLATDTKYRVSINYLDVGNDLATDTEKVTVENYPLQPVNSTLVDTTNVTPAATNYYPSTDGLDMGAYQGICIQGITSGGITTTIEVTNLDAPVSASTDWIDITKAGYELSTNTSGNASFVDVNFILDYDRLNVKAIRIKSINSDTSNVVEYYINRK